MSIQEKYRNDVERSTARAIAGGLTKPLAADLLKDLAADLMRSRVGDPNILEFVFPEPRPRR
jgi:hypothetical protein